MKQKLFISIITFLVSNTAFCGLVLQYSGGYSTFDNDENKIGFSRMHNGFYAGASVGRTSRVLLGPSYMVWSQEHKPSASASAEDISLSEFGANLMIYINKRKNWKIEVTYCPSVNGTRTVSGADQEIKGSSYRVALGYHVMLTNSIVIGGVVSYHTTSLESKVIANTQSDITKSYTQIVPMLEIGFRL